MFKNKHNYTFIKKEHLYQLFSSCNKKTTHNPSIHANSSLEAISKGRFTKTVKKNEGLQHIYGLYSLCLSLFFFAIPLFYFYGLWDPFKPKAEGFGFFVFKIFLWRLLLHVVCTGKCQWNVVYTSLIHNFHSCRTVQNISRAFSICFLLSLFPIIS